MHNAPIDTLAPITVPVNFTPERVEHAIAVMKEVIAKGYVFDLNQWYTPLDRTNNVEVNSLGRCDTADHVHACGTAACLMGWIALTEAWREAGGSVIKGTPHLGDTYRNIIEKWFGEDMPPLIHNTYTYVAVKGDEGRAPTELLDYYGRTCAMFDVSAYTTPAEAAALRAGGSVNIQATPEQVLKVLQQIRDEGTITLHLLSEKKT